jgi:peroxiredoxin
MNVRKATWALIGLIAAGFLYRASLSSAVPITPQSVAMQSTEVETPPPTPTEETGIEPGDLAPDFHLPGLELEEITLSEHRGHRMLLNFFTSWCVPCRKEMPGVQSQYEKHAKHDWVVIGVSIQEPTGDVVAFRDELGLTFPLALDTSGRVAYEYAVQGTPTNIMIDRDGRIVDRRLGYMSEAEIEAMLDAVP